MKKAFVFQDDKSNKFWWIESFKDSFVVNYGKFGVTGKYEIKEFDSEEECEKQAQKMISSKMKKGYKEDTTFDFINRFYFDDEEIGLNLLTSHPNFRSCFTEEFYCDCCDEEAPFGSDEGSDTLYLITEKLRKSPKFKFADFPRYIIEDEWGMEYIPVDDLSEDLVAKQIKDDEMNTTQSDMITYASAFAQIKISGKLDPTLKESAVKAMERYKITAKILEWGVESSVTNKMIDDLSAFKA